jgi:hypothetical protein
MSKKGNNKVGQGASREKQVSSQQTDGHHASRGGPRTSAGKARSSGNSRTHGIFSSELRLSALERHEFDQFKSKLRSHLRPNNPLLEVIFEDVVTEAWQMKMSLRCVQAKANSMLAETGASPESDGTESPMYFPYALTASEIRRRCRLCEEFRADVERLNYIHPEWEKPITEAFGSDFWTNVNNWVPPLKHLCAIAIGMVAVDRNDVYGSELPLDPRTPEVTEKFVANHDLAKREMVLKLIELQAQHLAQGLRWAEHEEKNPADQRDMRLDLFLRYRTTASRAFYRALAEYRKAAADSSGRSNAALEPDE